MTQKGAPGVELALATGDMGAISASFARVTSRVESYRAALRSGAKDVVDPIGDARPLAGKKAYDALGTLLTHDPVAREGARRAAAALIMFRIGADVERALFAALTEKRALLFPAGSEATFTESIAALACEREPRARAAHLDLMVRAATDVSAPQRELAVIRREVCVRLAVAPPLAYAAEVSEAALLAAAEEVLTSTERLFRDVVAREKKLRDEPSWTASSGIALARVDHATEGWPARVSREWLVDVVPALRKHAVAPGTREKLVGGSSFSRVLYAYGASLRRRSAPRTLPFYVAHDPWPRAAYKLGFLLAALPCSATFQRKSLGLGAYVAKDQALAFVAGALVSLRFLAARVLLALGDGSRERFTELTLAAFGAPFPDALAEAWPTTRVSDGARLIALLDAYEWNRTLVARFDDDWFRNPRAGREIEAAIAGPMRDIEERKDLGVSAVRARTSDLAKQMEAAFG